MPPTGLQILEKPTYVSEGKSRVVTCQVFSYDDLDDDDVDGDDGGGGGDNDDDDDGDVDDDVDDDDDDFQFCDAASGLISCLPVSRLWS